jgi:hypothetical protein
MIQRGPTIPMRTLLALATPPATNEPFLAWLEARLGDDPDPSEDRVLDYLIALALDWRH